jgi:hypothetical protein
MGVGSTAREYHTRQTHYIRHDLAHDDVASGTPVKIGTVPANALVLGTTVSVQTVFNAASTNVLIVGTATDDDALVAAGGVDETAVAVTRVAPATLGGLLSASADTPIYVEYTQSGTAATTGAATVIVEYAPADD